MSERHLSTGFRFPGAHTSLREDWGELIFLVRDLLLPILSTRPAQGLWLSELSPYCGGAGTSIGAFNTCITYPKQLQVGKRGAIRTALRVTTYSVYHIPMADHRNSLLQGP